MVLVYAELPRHITLSTLQNPATWSTTMDKPEVRITVSRDMVESLLVALESARNFVSGMTLDPSIPTHAKEALKSKSDELDTLIENTHTTLNGGEV